jgi:hypothetical protein
VLLPRRLAILRALERRIRSITHPSDKKSSGFGRDFSMSIFKPDPVPEAGLRTGLQCESIFKPDPIPEAIPEAEDDPVPEGWQEFRYWPNNALDAVWGHMYHSGLDNR